MNQVVTDIRRGIEILKRDGWSQGRYTAPDGSHCMIGAIREGIYESPREARGARLHQVITTVRFYLDKTSAEWNDQKGRTVEEVLSTLEQIAQIEENK